MKVDTLNFGKVAAVTALKLRLCGYRCDRGPCALAGLPNPRYVLHPLRGVWNEAALVASTEIILCEALIDAMTFWCAGHQEQPALVQPGV